MAAKTPVQVAEECEREAHEDCERYAKRAASCEALPVLASERAHFSITRALAARAWATAVRCYEIGETAHASDEQIEPHMRKERDRLRREFEALVEGKDGRG